MSPPPRGRRPTVLHFAGYDEDRGGVLTYVRNLALARRTDNIILVGPAFEPRRAAPAGCRYVRLRRGLDPERINPATLGHAFALATGLLPWLRAGPHRVFHGHSRAGMLVAFWLRLFGCGRAYASVHCYGRQRWLYRLCGLVMGDGMLWLSPAMKAYYGVPGRRRPWSGCLPGGPPAALFQAPLAGRRTGGDEGRIRLGGVGTLVPRKGWHLMLEALGQLSSGERGRLMFEHIGDAEDSAESRAYAAALGEVVKTNGLAATVTFHGWSERPAAFIDGLDWLVAPSTEEPFSLGILEALAAGVPVLAGDSGGCRDIVRPGINGLLFRSGDAADLARQLAAIAGGLPQPDPGAVRASVSDWDSDRLAERALARYRAAILGRPTRQGGGLLDL